MSSCQEHGIPDALFDFDSESWFAGLPLNLEYQKDGPQYQVVITGVINWLAWIISFAAIWIQDTSGVDVGLVERPCLPSRPLACLPAPWPAPNQNLPPRFAPLSTTATTMVWVPSRVIGTANRAEYNYLIYYTLRALLCARSCAPGRANETGLVVLVECSAILAPSVLICLPCDLLGTIKREGRVLSSLGPSP